MALTLELMPMEEKPSEAVPPKTMVVRYGFLKSIGEFPSEVTTKVGCGSKVVIRTDRGMEIGEMLTTTCENGSCAKSITREQMLAYIEKSGRREYPFTEQGRVLRVATAQDLVEQAKLDEHRADDVRLARQLVERHMLGMKIVDIEYILGKERVLIYFNSEQRIDFRNLVRDLAHELHARIELRQVGARDEARIVADYEKCGQHCCCKKFLKVLTPISMRSAKIQKATLDPAKISGRCGRLMCCLRYEDQTYEELRKKLPRRNTRVKTAAGEFWVLDGQILTQLVLVQSDDGTRTAIPIEQIEAFDLPKPKLPNGQTMQTPNDRMPEGAMPLVPVVAGRGPRPPVVRGKPSYTTPKAGEAGVAGSAVQDATLPPVDGVQGSAVTPAPAPHGASAPPAAGPGQRNGPVQGQNRNANQGSNQGANQGGAQNRGRAGAGGPGANTPPAGGGRPLPPRPARGGMPSLPPKLGLRRTPPLRGKLNPAQQQPQVAPPAAPSANQLAAPAGQAPAALPAAPPTPTEPASASPAPPSNPPGEPGALQV